MCPRFMLSKDTLAVIYHHFGTGKEMLGVDFEICISEGLLLSSSFALDRNMSLTDGRL